MTCSVCVDAALNKFIWNQFGEDWCFHYHSGEPIEYLIMLFYGISWLFIKVLVNYNKLLYNCKLNYKLINEYSE